MSSFLAGKGTVAHEALRGIRQARYANLPVVVILTFTLTAATTLFSVVDAVAIRPLPFQDPDRLVGITFVGPTATGLTPVSPASYFDWIDRTQAFEQLGAARYTANLLLRYEGTQEYVSVRNVTANLFDLLGIEPAVGRFFERDHERQGGPAAVILSHALWVRRFQQDPAVVGRRFDFGDVAREVVGVLPEGVWFPINAGNPPDIYVPYVVTTAERSNDRALSLSVVGRLRHDVPLSAARADVQRVTTRAVTILPLHEHVVGPASRWLSLLLAGVALVLLVGCANVASLLLARGTQRLPELATRKALGASSGRLVAVVMLEGLILAGTSVTVAFLLSWWGVGVVKGNLPPGLSRVSTIALDGRVMLICGSVAVFCGAAASLAPAWVAARSDFVGLTKGHGPSMGRRQAARMQSLFLVGNIAFVAIMMVAATLVVTTFVAVVSADLGFDRRNVVALPYLRNLDQPADGERDTAVMLFEEQLLNRARNVLGVTEVALATGGSTPLSGGHSLHSLFIPGYGETAREDWLERKAVTPTYFDVMRIELVRGRPFTADDSVGAPRVVIIDEAAARRFFAGRDPLGQMVRANESMTIVGVVRSIHQDGPERASRPAMYVPAAQDRRSRRWAAGSVLIRTSGDPRGVGRAAKLAIAPLVEVSITDPVVLGDSFRRLTAVRRFNAMLMSMFAGVVVILGALGTYGSVLFLVASQKKAIGLRMALGSSASRVMRDVLTHALLRVWCGSVVGISGAWLLSNVLESFVFGIRPTDFRVYVGVWAVLTLGGLASAFVPALRAARLDPLAVLRSQ